MSLLWKEAIALHATDPRIVHNVEAGPREQHVTEAGFKSHVWGTPYSGFWEHTHDPSQLSEDTRENIYGEQYKEPRKRSMDQYGDPNTAHMESHDRRAGEAMEHEVKKRQGNRNDELHSFLADHATNKQFWDTVPKQHVDLREGVHATQPTVFKEHLLRYLKNPYGETEHSRLNTKPKNVYKQAPDPDTGEQHEYYHTQDKPPAPEHVKDYFGNETPGFVRHNGKLHAVEGHHRVAAALMRGDTHIEGRLYDADKHGFPDAPEDDEMSQYEDHEPRS